MSFLEKIAFLRNSARRGSKRSLSRASTTSAESLRAEREEHKGLVRDDEAPEDLTDWAQGLGYVGPGGNLQPDYLENSTNSSILLNSPGPSSPMTSPSASRAATPIIKIDTEDGERSRPSTPKEVTRAGIQFIADVLKGAVTMQTETADHVAKRFLNPLGQRLNKSKPGTITLAEMARHFRLDRIVEALEGAIWVGKRVTEADTVKKINLDAELRNKMREAVGNIKVASEKMVRDWGANSSSRHLTIADMYSSSNIESKIYKLHTATELILHNLQDFLLIWINVMRKDPMSDPKCMAATANCLLKLSNMLVLLPLKYIPGCNSSASRHPSNASDASNVSGSGKRSKITDSSVTKTLNKASSKVATLVPTDITVTVHQDKTVGVAS